MGSSALALLGRLTPAAAGLICSWSDCECHLVEIIIIIIILTIIKPDFYCTHLNKVTKCFRKFMGFKQHRAKQENILIRNNS